ncbi:MAG TPA: VOC family protein [Steroidobacteraceae bacterium]|jgi:lactoylglutathione lyase
MKIRIFAVLAAAGGLAALTAHAENAPAASIAPTVKSQLAFTSYYVLDQKRALDFYVGLLGMSERQRITPSAGVTEIVLGFDQDPTTPGILLMHRADRATPYQIGDGFSRTIIRVSDVAGMVQRLTQAGVAIVRPPTEVANLKLTYAMVRDPDGYLIEFIQTH